MSTISQKNNTTTETGGNPTLQTGHYMGKHNEKKTREIIITLQVKSNYLLALFF